MRAHFPGRERNFAAVSDTSLAVLQFAELVRGERPVQAPSNTFQVEAVRPMERYCFHCFGVRWFDVIHAWYSRQLVQIKRCRHCGKESGG